jgi:uncharacterized protein YggE
MKKLIALTLVFQSLFVTAQDKKNNATVSVSGESSIKLQPDEVVLLLDATYIAQEVNQAIAGLDKKAKELSKMIVTAGLNEKEVKVNNFQINKHTVYNRGAVKDSGYAASQNMQVKFVYSKEAVAKILTAFSRGKTDYNMYFNFILSDSLKKKTETQLMKTAVKDAQQKANLLATEAGVKIKGIKTIEYGLGNDNRPYPLMNTRGAMMEDAANSNMQGFIPNDIELHDEVKVTYELE